MHFYLKIFCFSLVLHHHASESFVEFTFKALPLGHSGLLITWEPKITTQTGKPSKQYYAFMFKRYIIEEKNGESSQFDDHQNRSFARGNIEFDDGGCDSSAGQYKIHSLNESTTYEIIVRQYNDSGGDYAIYYINMADYPILRHYSVKIRTESKSKRIPAKPYFEVIRPRTKHLYYYFHLIKWYPCGRERTCHNQESGTHFGVIIKELSNHTRQFAEIEHEVFDRDSFIFVFLPGRKYEVIVYSVNGEYKTYSDAQEIFMNPIFSPVQNVNAISLPDSSVLISWKSPKQLSEKSLGGTRICYSNATNLDSILLYDRHKFSDKLLSETCQRINISSMIPEITYTYLIIPSSDDYQLGSEYQITHKHRAYNHELPIAKPDFTYKVRKNSYSCSFEFYWLPCGQSFDCTNTQPGSDYSFQFKPEPWYESKSKLCVYYEASFNLNLTYEVTVKSLVGEKSSEPVTKIFKNCEEIQENVS